VEVAEASFVGFLPLSSAVFTNGKSDVEAVYFVHVGRKYGLPKVRAFIETALELAPVSR
jgi:hypothetical protein